MIRVGVTTAADRAAAVAEFVTLAGAKAVMLPCIAVTSPSAEDADTARALCDEADMIVITSARAVRALWPTGGMPTRPVAAVGTATAAAVLSAGGTVLTLGRSDGAGLVEQLGNSVAGLRIALPQSAAATTTVAAGLRANGAEVHAVDAYAVEPIAAGDAPIDAALFASPTAVEGFTQSRDLDDIVVAAIGETTAKACRAHGAEPDVIPVEPSYPAMAAGVVALIRERIAS